MPSMMMASPTVIEDPLNHVKIAGLQRANRLANRTHSGNALTRTVSTLRFYAPGAEPGRRD
jgi:hypothetical protein